MPLTPDFMLSCSSVAMVWTAFITFIACLCIPAPYGRYSKSKGWGYLISAPIAWFIMESPNLWMPFVVYFSLNIERNLNFCNKILLSLYYIHYINRTIVYPYRMPKSSSPMPISVMSLAFIYCCWNSFTQALSLCVVNKYE